MKNLCRFLGIIAVVAVIGFSLAGCGDNGDSGGNNNGGNNSGALSGVYSGQGDYDDINCTFSGSNYTINVDGHEYERGSYLITGATVKFIPTWNDNNDLASYTGTLSGSNNSTITVQGITFIKGNNSGGNNNGGDVAVTFNSVIANGSSTQTTTQLTLTFSQAITGLSASDITLSGMSGASKGTLNGSGSTYTLGISGFTGSGTLSVAVAKSGYAISGSPKTVSIYYSGGEGNGGGTAPSAPTNVTATAQSSSSISVSWSAVTGATSYDVYYEIGSSSTKNFAGNTSSASYTHTGLQASTDYYYYIKAKNGAGESGYSSYSSAASATTQSGSSGGGTAPSTPTGVSATAASSSSITVSWSSVSGATGYYVYRSSSSSGTYTQVGSPTSTSYTNSGLSANTTYYYKVAAYNSNGTGSQSSYVSATTQSGGGGVTKPSTPTGVTASRTPTSNEYVTISWNAVSGATSYRLYMSTSASGTYNLAANVNGPPAQRYVLNDLTTYWKVSAVNDAGESAQSSYASAPGYN
jgi:fibronectin type 3 domain-containing protein